MLASLRYTFYLGIHISSDTYNLGVVVVFLITYFVIFHGLQVNVGFLIMALVIMYRHLKKQEKKSEVDSAK